MKTAFIKTLRSKARFAAKLALVICFSVGFLELASRVIHWWKAPLLPYHFDDGATMLPVNSDFEVSFARGLTARYITDAWGARIGDAAVANERLSNGVVVVGDSQVLGYSIDFPNTFASRIALSLTGNANGARIVGAPASHPGTFRASLHKYLSPKPAKQRLFIVGLNLGNDLDELYDEGVNVTHEKDPVGAWLLANSYLYMDVVLVRSHWLQHGDYPLGINPIFYMLDAQERVILAREAVHCLDELLTDPAIEADQKVLVIVPADIQLDPGEFLKYRRFYASEAEFDKWNQQVFALAGTMNALEEYISKQLEERGHRVVRASKLVSSDSSPADFFDRRTHHLSARAHESLAKAIIDKLR